MLLTYKFRIYPSKRQQKRLFEQFGICKEIYNELLNQNKKYLINRKFDFNYIIKDIKITSKYYSQVHSQVLQNISDRVGKSLDNFFRRVKEKKQGKKVKAGYPRFKSKIKSITYPQSGFKFINKKLYVSKIGNIPIVLHRNIKDRIKTMTIKINQSNQWFVCFSCEISISKINHNSNKKVGIDVGLENFATLSNGKAISNPRYLIKSEKQLKKLQRKLSRKKKGSNKRKKAILKVAKQHIKISNQRNDFLHKLSRNLTINNKIIAVESLNIKGMVHHKYLAKHIHDASWNKFIQLLSYKAVMSGGQIIENPRTRGSSKRCSYCSNEMDMPLSKRIFECSKCGLTIDRDYNAAINHLNDTAGLVEIYTPVDDYVRPSLLKAKIYEAGTTRNEL